MALGTLSLTTTQGVRGRRFAAKIIGLTTGKLEIGGNCAPGFSTVNGMLYSDSLPYAVSTVSLIEYDPGAALSRNETRIEINAAGDAALTIAADGSTIYSVAKGPAPQTVIVPTATGVIYTVTRLLGSTSTLALTSASNSNLSINAANGAISATSAIAAGASQTAVVREVNGSVNLEYPVVLTGASAGGGAPTLNTLTVSNSSGTVGQALSSTINGLTSGSSVALTGAGAAGLSISGAVITGTPTTAGAVNLVETLAGAANSPRTTSGAITVAAAASALPKFRAALAKSKAGTGPARIVMMGNSTFTGVGDTGTAAFTKSAATPTLLANKLAARGYNTSVESFFSDNAAKTVNNVAYNAYDPRFSDGTGWTQFTPASSIGFITLGGTLWKGAAANSLLSFTPATAFDTYEIYYAESTSGGTLNILLDGVQVQSCNTLNANPALKKVVLTCPLGTHKVSFGGGTSSNNVFLVGMIAYDSTKSPVIVINAGKSGGYAKEATNQYWYGQLPVLQAIAPDLTVIAEDINEWAYDAANTSGYLTALQGIVAAAQVSGDAILCTNFSSQTTGSFVSSLPQSTQDSIAAVTRQAAASSTGVPLIDMYADLGTGDAAAAAGKMFDQLHRNAAGYAEVATYLDGKISALAGLN
jgi:hypothetical protein